jgi:hypothetical protein
MSFIILDKTYVQPLKEWMNVVGKPSSVNALNRCVKDLIDAGIWMELDLFHLIGGLDTDGQRLRPLKTTSATKTFTAVASPTLDRTGVTGNGSTSYLNLNWQTSRDGVKYTQNNCSFGYYSRTQSAAGLASDIGENASYISPRRAGDNFVFRIQDFGGDSITNTITSGLISVTRTASTTKTAYKSGVSFGAGSTASGSLRLFDNFLCSHNVGGAPTNPSTKNIASCYFGSANFDHLKFYQIIQNYMNDVGLAV